jgi:hypothetical protein
MPAAGAGSSVKGDVLSSWADGFAAMAAFQTARSALGALLRQRQVRRTWLPAYICANLADGAVGSGGEVAFYRVGPDLVVDTDALSEALRPGDAVVGVDFFGFIDPGIEDLVRRFDDLLWIEDRAQALEPGPAWGRVLLYSPRKLFGVADGGLLLANGHLPEPTEPAGEGVWRPEDARAADRDGAEPQQWYPLFRAREAAFEVCGAAATSRTLTALRAIPVGPEAEARRRNWNALRTRLADYALWPQRRPDGVPLAFPIVVSDAAEVQRRLAAERIWAPRHWADLPSPPDLFPDAAALAARLISLPCDSRYDAEDMARVAGAVRRVASPHPQ